MVDKVKSNEWSRYVPPDTSAKYLYDKHLPNGYTRNDYKEFGFTDFDIEFWGLDQPGAPDPPMAGWMIWDVIDGELDGEIDF